MNVRESAEFIAKHSRDARVVTGEGLEQACRFLYNIITRENRGGIGNRYSMATISDAWHRNSLHPAADSSRCINHLLLMDLLNFSFYSDNRSPDEPPFQVSYKGKSYTGYWTLCACLNRALDEGIHLLDATVWQTMSEDQLNHIFRPDSGASTIPMFSDRLRLIRSAGEILNKNFDGDFGQCVLMASKSALKLVDLISHYFPDFRDQSNFNNRTVLFYKRAQILVADIWACFGGEGLGEFHDIDGITMFADYRVPQILCGIGALEYSEELLEFLRTGEQMSSGDRREMEIRGNSIHAVELIVAKLNEMLNEIGQSPVNAIIVDFILWDYAKLHAEVFRDIPIHRVRSIYY